MSFYTSLTGLNAATAMLGVTSNNISNVGTTGFKRSRADFGDIFATSPLQKASSTVGQGVSLKQVSQEFSQGNISFSSNALDLAITGDGFFPMRSADGLQELFTRNGSFLLNEQFNVVNSSGQRLMAATVDSTGSANVNERVVLTIPQKTSGEAKQTSKVELGLNFPADAQVITEPFNRSNPSTYNKSTAFTVYDNGGNGYLATIYYVKTANANQNSPFNKWQTHVFVGEDQVNASLVQATNSNNEKLYVNQYGKLAQYSDIKDELTTGKTQLLSFDELTDIKISEAAQVSGQKAIDTDFDWSKGVAIADLQDYSADLAAAFTVDIDNSTEPVTLDLSGILNYTKSDVITGDILAKEATNYLNKQFGDDPTRDLDKQRFGISVSFDPVNKKFTVKSGTTGDTSSIKITNINDNLTALLGFSSTDADDVALDPTSATYPYKVMAETVATRGTISDPTTCHGSTPTVNTATNFKVDSTNCDFIVTVDGIKGKVTLDTTKDYSLADFTQALEDKINSLESNDEDGLTKKTVNGVKVAWDATNKWFTFTSGTTGPSSYIKISGDAKWGLSNAEAARGTTSSWTKPTQHVDYVNGSPQPKYIDGDGNETTSSDGYVGLPAWSPVFLDKGELTFDTGGNLVSPVAGTQLETVYLAGGKGALTINIDYSASTQFSSAFAVLSQSQDGAPEGDLVGVTIANDGLVSASFSNGTQKSLAKILLVNFSSPVGLRQIGDSSFLASAASGKPILGTAGSAGFGTLRAGATERANVDLTQELVDLITAQRNFQANAKAIETSSTMTSAIINLRS